jgi:hypothetical protein
LRTVWKYPLATVDAVLGVNMPEGAKLIHVDADGRNGNSPATVWAEVDTDAPQEERMFFVVGTNKPIPPGMQHVGSCHSPGGVFVWHVYTVPTLREAAVRAFA